MAEDNSYDVVAVGTGFSTSFFLHRLLSKSPSLRVLVLESGARTSHSDLLDAGNPHQVNGQRKQHAATLFHNTTPEKTWNFTHGFGGSSACWYACTPRMLPEDFKLKTTYNIGTDWPVSYEELEPYYCDVESLMSISGSNELPGPWPMSRPYVQEPHSYSEAAKLFKVAFPNEFFPQATARQRDACCASNVCGFCPVDAKFTIENGLSALYSEPRVELRLNAPVQRFDYVGNAVKSVTYFDRDLQQETQVHCDLLTLGANAMFNPHIMFSSELRDEHLGRGLVETVTVPVDVEFEDFQNYQGSTITAGSGFMLYSGDHRRQRAAALMSVDNRVKVSPERGRWLSRMRLLFGFEDLRLPDNRVTTSGAKPTVTYTRRSEYCDQGIQHLSTDVPKILNSLDVDIREFSIGTPWSTDSHIQGTHVMGDDEESSVVDRGSVHHRLRNLVVLGGGVFPTAPPANPTLTICALASLAADKIA